ncbi:MAG: CCA tRNA nucleotidyltransferase [Chloroflexi bacterium]|nr:MAG: CCA tRNA nucleotidyltransferase [Chloroflexota bacterium]
MPTGSADGRALQLGQLPEAVAGVLARLGDAGHQAALVGGSLRDLLRGSAPGDWDVATSAPPEQVAALFPGATWENPFGTVTVRATPGPVSVEVTTFRVEAGYRDQRRPDEVRWGGSLEEDLSRRDFTINAIGWIPEDLRSRRGLLVDPYDGAADLQRGVLRAVGDPDQRFSEDALRILRAVRFATRFGLELDPATEDALRRHAAAAGTLSGERVRDELLRILGADQVQAPPSRAFAMMERLGLLVVVLPELQAMRGVPQAKARPGDALDHSLRTADALPAGDPYLRLFGLLHDLGKASTLGDGHFIGHEVVGAQMVEAILRRLHVPRVEVARGRLLVRHHMFAYAGEWTDAAVRRFIRRVGASSLADLFALRRADDVASGVEEPQSGGLDELRARVGVELATSPLSAGQLAVRGDDLINELGVRPGPIVGRLLAELLEAVLENPALNERDALLALAHASLARGPEATTGGAGTHRPARSRP